MSRLKKTFNNGVFQSEMGYWASVSGDGPNLLRVTRIDGDYLEGEMFNKAYRVLRRDYAPQWKQGYE
jgi:hypothetical protein